MPSLRTINQLLMRAAMPALVLLLSSIIAVLYLDARQQDARQQEARHLGLVLDATRAEFLKSLNSVMYLATGVAAYIQANNGYVATEQTSSWLRSLPSYNPYIRNIGLAPDNRISFVYPLEGNQKVIGVSYRDLPEQWPRVALAMQRREPVMDGPVTLLQGGLGLVYRVPVFLHGGRFWGMVSTVMSLDHVMAGLQEQAGRQGVTLRFLPEQEAGALTRDWHVVEMRVGDMSWRLAGRRTAAAGEETDHHAYWVWAFVIFLTMGSLQLSALSWRQRELQDSLNESLSLFRVAFQHVPHGLLVLDRRQRIVEANPLIRTLLGRPDASLRGLGLLDILADAQREAARLAMAEAADRGERTFESMLEVLPGPRQVPVEVSVVALSHDKLGSLAFIRDIRESRRLQQIQSEFISTASHELRTPLTSIIGALDLLRSGAFGQMPETASPLLDMATGNSDRLHRLINDLLDTNRLMQDNLQLDMRVTDAVGIVRDVAASLMPMALKDGMHLTLQVPERQMVMADGERLAQVLVNLMANAIRFSRPGGEVIVRMAPEGGQVRFSVQDFGQGIDPSFASKAFTRFGQADASDTRSQGGTGLGLFICKGLVERMGGRIGYDSRPGEGATFWFSLPGGADDGAGV